MLIIIPTSNKYIKDAFSYLSFAVFIVKSLFFFQFCLLNGLNYHSFEEYEKKKKN